MGKSIPSAHGFTVSADLIRGLIDCAAQCGVPRPRLTDMVICNGSAKPASSPPARYSGDIAFLLGYSEESAFSRAYKSWTGRPPSETHSRGAPTLSRR